MEARGAAWSGSPSCSPGAIVISGRALRGPRLLKIKPGARYPPGSIQYEWRYRRGWRIVAPLVPLTILAPAERWSSAKIEAAPPDRRSNRRST